MRKGYGAKTSGYFQANQRWVQNLPVHLQHLSWLGSLILTSSNSLRKIKCDETRPFCSKCTSSRRECNFGIRILSGSSSRVLLPTPDQRCPRGSKDSMPLIGQSPNTPESTCISSFANAEDRRAYDFFLNVSLDEIGSTSPSGSEWIRIALQHSTLKPIFHAIAAVGKAHGSICRVSHFTLVRLEQPSELRAATIQYVKSVSALQRYIDDVVERQAAIEPVLIACLLLTCYEILVDRKGTASSHYRLGRTIIEKSLSTTAGRSGAGSPSTGTIEQLAAAFKSLGHGGEYYWKEFEIANASHSSIQPCIPGSLPATFTSFVEADVHLETIVRLGEEARNVMIQLAQARIKGVYGESLGTAVSFCLANCLSRSIDIPAALQHRLEEVIRAHGRWLHMLRMCILQQDPVNNPILLLTQIRYFASWLVMSTCRETREVAVDRFESEFVRVLDMAETYFQRVSGQPLPMRPSHLREAIGLSLEGGILPALHLIACKSRSSTIRRRASQILITADRQEGTCYSGIIGLIVGCATEIEEARARTLRKDPIHVTCSFSSDQVPEEARFADSVIEGGPGLPPKFKLVCARYMHDQAEKIELLEYYGEGFPLDLSFVVARVIDCAK
jgi:hypothetical protein